MIDFQIFWTNIENILAIFDKKPICFDANRKYIHNICYQMDRSGDINSIHEIIWLETSSFIRNEVVKNFWKHFKCGTHTVCRINNGRLVYKSLLPEELNQLFQAYVDAVEELVNIYKTLTDVCNRLQNVADNMQNCDIWTELHSLNLQEYLSEQLFSCLPSHFVHVVQAFFYVSLRVFENLQQKKDIDKSVQRTNIRNSKTYCLGCELEENKCDCLAKAILINDINNKMRHMGLLDRLAGQTIASLIQSYIDDRISETCSGVFDKHNLKELEMWIDQVVCNWLRQTFYDQFSNSELSTHRLRSMENLHVKLKFFLYESFANCLIDQFFTIIIDFPDSIPAIDDLKICLDKIDVRKKLISRLKASLESKILHAGVNTIDILTGYIAAIKAIRHLDHSGIVLNTVTQPIKEYLRKRSDTVRRVVTGLTEEGPTDLSEELAKGEALKECQADTRVRDINDWESWVPEPSGLENVHHNDMYNPNKSADIISMIVDIYGSKELFMNEYRNLMADRLLTQLDFNVEKEIRNLELLKIRFGEPLLHSCEVMLKDVTDSKRINTHIQSDSCYNADKKFDISSLIISAQYWPPFNKECLDLPEEIAAEFQKFIKSYEAYKGNRTLQFRHITGRVNIVLDIGNRSLDLTVPPTVAVIIYHFQSKNEWSLEDLSNVMKIPPTILRRRMQFWQQNGILIEKSPDIYKLVEETETEIRSTAKQSSNLMSDEDDIESAMATASEQREEELQVFWSYIVGMLTNLDSLPLERIHQMLKLFAAQGIGMEFSLVELKDFLQRKVREHKLIFSGGVYQLSK